MKKIAALLFIGMVSILLAGCEQHDAEIASENLSKAADNFEVRRRLLFINTRSGEPIWLFEGLCSVSDGETGSSVAVTCKVGPKAYQKHLLGLSTDVTWLAEQIDEQDVSVYHYRRVFKPSAVIPDIDVR